MRALTKPQAQNRSADSSRWRAWPDDVRVGVFDLDGILRGKFLSREKFFSALEHGFGFCDVVLGWDSGDQLYDNVQYTGWHTGYPDAPVRILPETARNVSTEPGMLMFLAEFAPPADAICPRGVLRRVPGRAPAHGFDVLAALEYEFFVFDERRRACARRATAI